ncbi:M23 family metallopeptidase [Modestobacter sp. VKM Ac-2977]|uniref:M23 family metallopeptidase n=1 Tax=Modestobacter sp. VKM Ac-2977 TaxID=3004131 RepID=UPI0022AA2663|nr:M23 family metallopeptidase [Modestobacter sp. VKM Ac-2977]MCZ2819506.1 M23 family metallopeptidase [Modestobacter sp. VKM Ac-2977]
MDPQHLTRLDDEGTVRSTGAVGGSVAATPPSDRPEVLASVLPFRRAVRRPRRLLGAASTHTASVACHVPAGTSPVTRSEQWPLPVEGADPVLVDSWPLGPASTPLPADAAPAAEVTASPRRRLTVPVGRPALFVAAAILGVVGLGLTAAGSPPPVARAAADEPVSVAEELGMVQADQPALTGEEAAARLQELAATRAQREDAEAAAAQVQAEADRVAAEAAAAAAAEAARPKAVLPVQGRLTSQFGSRWGTLHAGIDFAAPLGTPEYAVMDGVVLRAGAASGFGLAVYVQHANGDVSVYGHMQEILVEEGQTVRAGDTIALLGNEGQSTGPHLHFEVHAGGLDGPRIDPLPWLRERGVAI